MATQGTDLGGAAPARGHHGARAHPAAADRARHTGHHKIPAHTCPHAQLFTPSVVSICFRFFAYNCHLSPIFL